MSEKKRDAILILSAIIFLAVGYLFFSFYGGEKKIGRETLLGSIGGGLGGETQTGSDHYPWINTMLFNNLKDTASYTSAEAIFVADHFDLASAHLQFPNQQIKQNNPDIKILPFTGIGNIGNIEQTNLAEFFQLNPQYSFREKENVYIHYKCDVFAHFETIKGCNLKNAETGECFGTPAPGCSASSASRLEEARVPDPDSSYHALGWLMPNFKSPTYKDYGPWRLKKILNYYVSPPNNGSYPADGVWWDNILYLGSLAIDKTIEYWGEPDSPNQEHPRGLDYHNYFLEVKNRVEEDPQVNRSLIWLGNVNNMFWIRQGGPYTDWVLSNLELITPESWISPRGAGEYATPSWFIDCPDLKEAWNYTNQYGRTLAVFTYNYGDLYGSDPMTKIFSLAKYYLVKNQNLFYGYREDSRGTTGLDKEWNPMAGVNIGAPRVNPPGVLDFDGQSGTEKFFDWKNPSAPASCSYAGRNEVLAGRHFTNGLIIARWKANRWESGVPPAGPEYNSDADSRVYSLSNPYGSSYYVVQTNGALSATPVSEITLATNQAAILLNACGEGEVPNGLSCGCGGQVLSAGEWCCGGQNKFVCSNDEQCNFGDGEDLICQNPGSCGAQCVPAPPPPPPPPPNSYVLTVSKSGTGAGEVVSTPNGIDCGEDCDQYFSAGAEVTLNAVPQNNSMFGGWSGACSGANTTCVLTMNGNLSVSVSFNLLQQPLPQTCSSGERRSCVVGSCAGNQICSNGVWSDCAKTDLCCGVNCNDNNTCTQDSCSGGVCSNVNICQLPPVPVSDSDSRIEPIPTPEPAGGIDINNVNKMLSQIGKSMKTILYVLNGIAVLVFIIALFH